MANDSKVIVLVGDPACGKSSLASMISSNIFTTNHFETVFEDYHAEINGADGLVHLKIYDTSGEEAGDGYELRKFVYPEADAVLICFDLTSPTSIDNVERRWIPEVTDHCPNKPYFLVGCKKDLLRTLRKFSVDCTNAGTNVDSDSSGYMTGEEDVERESSTNIMSKMNSLHVNHASLWALLLRSGATHYFECSARTSESVLAIFSKVLHHLENSAKKSRRSTWPRGRSLEDYISSQMCKMERSTSTSYLSTVKKNFKKKFQKLRRTTSESHPPLNSRRH